MLKVKLKMCKKCGKPYTRTTGGIVPGPEDFEDTGLCEECEEKSVKDKIKKVMKRITD